MVCKAEAVLILSTNLVLFYPSNVILLNEYPNPAAIGCFNASMIAAGRFFYHKKK